MHDAAKRSNIIKTLGISTGFSRVGIAGPGPYPEASRLEEWLARGYHGDMAWLARQPERRASVQAVKEWTRSVVALALDYDTDHPRSKDVPDDPERGWISRFAWGRDYHDVIEARLRGLVQRLDAEPLTRGRYHWYVDTGPVLERIVGVHAGLGWQGKNTLLIHPRAGSFFFLAVVLTDLELEPDGPIANRCGSCTRCLDACPTRAFPEPTVLDARRCVSYLTIESKGEVPGELRAGVGRHVFGCDLCQDVCPWNRKAPVTDDPAFLPREGLVHPQLSKLAALGEQAFRERFRRSPIKRRKFGGFMSNVRNAATRRTSGEAANDES